MHKVVVVRWNLADSSKPKGEAISHDGGAPARKIVFPDRRWLGKLTEDSLWECSLICDTLPNESRRGALIVRPLRPLTWTWANVGEPLWGVHERALKCVEYPLRPSDVHATAAASEDEFQSPSSDGPTDSSRYSSALNQTSGETASRHATPAAAAAAA